MEFINKIFTKELLLFVGCGSISTICNITSRMFFSIFMELYISIILAYIIGMIVAFLLFKYFVFNSNTGSNNSKYQNEIFKFVLVNMYGLIQTIVFSYLFCYVITWLAMQLGYVNLDKFIVESISHISALGLLTITSFWMHKKFTFKKESL